MFINQFNMINLGASLLEFLVSRANRAIPSHTSRRNAETISFCFVEESCADERGNMNQCQILVGTAIISWNYSAYAVVWDNRNLENMVMVKRDSIIGHC